MLDAGTIHWHLHQIYLHKHLKIMNTITANNSYWYCLFLTADGSVERIKKIEPLVKTKKDYEYDFTVTRPNPAQYLKNYLIHPETNMI